MKSMVLYKSVEEILEFVVRMHCHKEHLREYHPLAGSEDAEGIFSAITFDVEYGTNMVELAGTGQFNAVAGVNGFYFVTNLVSLYECYLFVWGPKVPRGVRSDFEESMRILEEFGGREELLRAIDTILISKDLRDALWFSECKDFIQKFVSGLEWEEC